MPGPLMTIRATPREAVAGRPRSSASSTRAARRACQEGAQEARGGQLKSESQLVVGSFPHVDQITVGIVKVEVGGKLLIRWLTNKVAVRLFLGVSEEFGWHRRRSLRRR